mmetsp:Transcript_30925/g.27351  ORF Transcript_30925/g.27351 Transcript_30925/m.27351 type:complete len:163 (-) Transcript_30925:285-773(-)
MIKSVYNKPRVLNGDKLKQGRDKGIKQVFEFVRSRKFEGRVRECISGRDMSYKRKQKIVMKKRFKLKLNTKLKNKIILKLNGNGNVSPPRHSNSIFEPRNSKLTKKSKRTENYCNPHIFAENTNQSIFEDQISKNIAKNNQYQSDFSNIDAWDILAPDQNIT